MFGIGGGEFIFIILLILMFFGSDKIPELARNLGKGMAHLKNATNDLKSEIQKGAADSGLDARALTGGISDEITAAKEGFTRMVEDAKDQVKLQSELDLVREKLAAAERELAAKQQVDLPDDNTDNPFPEPIKRT
jgi:sec-independent protein translocase protein TatA